MRPESFTRQVEATGVDAPYPHGDRVHWLLTSDVWEGNVEERDGHYHLSSLGRIGAWHEAIHQRRERQAKKSELTEPPYHT